MAKSNLSSENPFSVSKCDLLDLTIMKVKIIIWTHYFRLSAGLLRQATYTTTRLGIYTSLFEYATR